MRLLSIFVIALAAISHPALAQDGERYVNEAMGFEVTLPAGFERTFADGEMVVLRSADGTREILLLGGTSFDPLERLVERQTGYDEQDGWTTEVVASAPSWASYAGRRNGIQTFVRLIEICPRWSFARLQVDYPDRDAVAIAPLIDRLTASFRATGTVTCPAR